MGIKAAYWTKVLFTDKLWTLDTSGCSRLYRRLVRFIKLCRITISTFAENRMSFQCVALSYFITLAAIPFLATVFAVTNGLGIADRLPDLLTKLFPTSPQLVGIVLEKANGIIDTAKGGGVGFISSLIFLWAIIWLMFQIERVFNNVWGIRKIPRKIYKRFVFYLIAVILMPLIVVIFSTGIIYYSNLTRLIGLDLSDLTFIPKLLGYLGFYAVAVLTLAVMYKYIPAAQVSFRNALKSAIVTAIFFCLFQYLYLETQVFVGRLNRAYGIIAAVPFFLIWLNFSWQIIIYGAELTYSYQNVDKYHIPEWDREHPSK